MIRQLKNKILSLIERSTQFTGTDLRFILKGSIWTGINQFVSNTALLIQITTFARYLPKDVYGTYSFIQSWGGIFSLFAVSGLPNAIAKSIAKGNEGELQTSLRLKLRWGIISSLLALGFSGYYWWQGNPTLSIAFLIVAIFLPPYLAVNMSSQYFLGKQLFKELAIIDTLYSIITVGIMVVVTITTHNLICALLAYFIPPIIVRGSVVWWIIKKHQTNQLKSDETQSLALHFTAMNILGGFSKRIDQLLLFHLSGPSELAIYRFALIPIEKLQMIPDTLAGVSFPRFVKRSYPEIYKSIAKKIFFYTLLITSIVLAYIFLAPLLYDIFFPNYKSSVTFSRILALPFILSGFSFIHFIWIGKGEIKRLYILKVITHVSRIAFFAMLIPMYGIQGAIGSIISASLLTGATILHFFLKDRKKYVPNNDNGQETKNDTTSS